MPFKKGKSGNPGGLPKGYRELKSIAMSHAPEAIEKLLSIMRAEPMNVSWPDRNGKLLIRKQIPSITLQMEAALHLLERGLGKPVQPLSEPDGETPLQINKIERVIVQLEDNREPRFSRIIEHDVDERPRERLRLNGG